MKNIFKTILSLLVIVGGFASCSNESDFIADGEGSLNLSLKLNDDVKVVSRSKYANELDSLAHNCRVYIYSKDGLIRKYHDVDSIPQEIWLVSGEYSVQAWAGDSVPASYTKKYFKGVAPFSITKGANVSASVECKIQNTVSSVVFETSVGEVLSDYKITIGTSKGTLDFTAENAETDKGYYMMPEDEGDLTWTITGKQANGSDFTQTGTVPNAKASTEYKFTVKYDSTTDLYGGGMLTVTVDESTIDVEDNITLTAAPKIIGSGFDLAAPVYSQQGGFYSKISVYTTAAAKLTSLEISCDNFASIAGLSSKFDLIKANADVLEEIKAAGIYLSADAGCGYNEANDEDIEKIVFTKELLNSLENGAYNITITATDAQNKSRVAVLDLEISDASVFTLDAAEVHQLSAVLAASIAKTEATGLGFEYREKGKATWIANTDVTISGAEYTLKVSELSPATTYQYRAICDGFTSNDVKEFTTNSLFQLKNGGFEDNQVIGKQNVFYAGDASNLFWDTGNTGSMQMSKNVTVPDASVKHSGSYSVKLQSQFVGLGIVGKFAAGNIFIGQYLETSMNPIGGVLGFGRPFVQDDGPRPTALHGYVKYNCGTVNYGGDKIANNATDVGSIYIAMLDNSTVSHKSYSGWPVIVDTTIERLFSSTDSNVMGYGEKDYTASTDGDGMVEFTIPITYSKDGMPSSILVVGSASKYGDYFQGSEDSVMWLDDLELIY